MTANPSPTDDLELDELFNKVFSAGIGFARGESMMQAGHLKMTPEAAKAALTAREARKVEEAAARDYEFITEVIHRLDDSQDNTVDFEGAMGMLKDWQHELATYKAQLQHQTRKKGE